ncbi:hypothetical protein [Nocardia sp. NPDC052566]|uniref:hypothetical protein n=1 Tax=Nocardia sp. NPDC052566 TaxID=3364330 RepID=UPI0037C76ADE
MRLEDYQRLVAETEEQIEAFSARVHNVISSAAEQPVRARSSDGLAVAVVSGDGRQVLDINLPQGLGDFTRPAWALTEDLDTTCRAIVEAVNKARNNASTIGIEQLRQEFPDAYDLLTDLNPDGNQPAR